MHWSKGCSDMSPSRNERWLSRFPRRQRKAKVDAAASRDGFTARKKYVQAGVHSTGRDDPNCAGIRNITPLHSGCEANFKNPCRSGSCSISESQTGRDALRPQWSRDCMLTWRPDTLVLGDDLSAEQ